MRFLFLVLIFFSLPSTSQSQQRLEQSRDRWNAPHAPGHLIVKWKNETHQTRFVDGLSGQRTAPMEIGGSKTLELRKFRKEADLRRAAAVLEAHPGVAYVEPDYILTARGVPNDPSFSTQWALQNTGQSGGEVDADINAPDFWDLTLEQTGVVVAVIDSGCQTDHEDLVNTLWVNPGETADDGIDNDGNGYIDDINGYDFANNDNTPMDQNGHGTHVAGIIAAESDNGLGIAGVARGTVFICMQFMDSSGNGLTSDAIDALEYVRDLKENRGINVLMTNNSWGGGGFSQSLYDEIKNHRDAGLLFIAATDNSVYDVDYEADYPGSFGLDNILTVMNTDRNDEGQSAFGTRSIMISAPGEDIYSTLAGSTSDYGLLSGTSMAAPHVSGLIAFLSAYESDWDWIDLRNLILAGGEADALSSTITGRRLRGTDSDAEGSVDCSEQTVRSRMSPTVDDYAIELGASVSLKAISITCENADSVVTATRVSDSSTISLLDDGSSPDQIASDGIFAATFTPSTAGLYQYTIFGSDTLTVNVYADDSVWYGYRPASTTYNYRTLTGSKTQLTLGNENYATALSDFPIPFAGDATGFRALFVSSNGHMSVTDSYPYTDSNDLLPVSDYQTWIAPLWTDLDVTSATGGVYYETQGTSPNREFIIEYDAIPRSGGDAADAVTFQVVFFESSSDVLFNYKDTEFSSGSSYNDGGQSSVGIQVSSTLAASYSYRSASDIENEFALLFSENNAPDVEAGDDQTVTEGATVTLSGSGVDSRDSDSVTYKWTQTSGGSVTILNSTSTSPSFLSGNRGGQTLVLKLTVTDEWGATASDTVSIIVHNSSSSGGSGGGGGGGGGSPTPTPVNKAPSASTNLYPLGTIEEAQPMLSADAAIDGDGDKVTHQVQLAQDAKFIDLILDREGIAGVFGKVAIFSPALESGVDYYWRIRGHDGKLYGPWTQASFIIKAAEEPVIVQEPQRKTSTCSTGSLPPSLWMLVLVFGYLRLIRRRRLF